MYKCILVHEDALSFQCFRCISPTRTWALIMLGSGHFSAGIFRLADGECRDKKSIHKYTTRKKQGGAQSANDSAKGKAKSAGAQIRRANEVALTVSKF